MPRRSAYFLLAFPLAVLFVFTLLPTVAGLGLSLFQWDGGGLPRFVGLTNFQNLMGDSRFTPALRNTLVFVVATVPVTTALGFLLAVALHARWFRGRAAARAAFFLPTVCSIVAIGFVWRWLIDPQGGLVPGVLHALGLPAPDLINGGPAVVIGGVPLLSWPMAAIVVVQIWRGIGFCMVLYLAALAGVNESLYEAAEVDGASRWRVLRHVTWPQVGPMTVFLLVTGVIGALQVFDIVWAMTNGTETDATNVLNLYVFREFQRSRLGSAAAIGVVIFALTIGATALQLALLRGRGRA